MIYTINAVPSAGFISPGFPLSFSLAIPSAVFYSGYWHVEGNQLVGLIQHTDRIETAGLNNVDFPTIPDGVFSEDVNVTYAQLVEINSNSGGVMFANIHSDSNITTSVIQLILDDTPPVPPPSRRSIGYGKRGKRVIRQIFPPIYFSVDISAFSTPFGIQINKNAWASGFQFIPGLIYLNGVRSNSDLGMRIYKGHFKAENEFTQTPNIPDSPIYTQVCDVPIEIPFLDMLDFFIEFYNDGTAIPANSSLEFTIIPFIEK